MRKFAIHCIPGVIHCIFTFVFLKLMLSSSNQNTLNQFILLLFILLLINAISYAWISKGSLRILSKHIYIYILFGVIMFYHAYTSNLIELSLEGILAKSVVIYVVFLVYSLAISIVGAILGAILFKIIRVALRYHKNTGSRDIQL